MILWLILTCWLLQSAAVHYCKLLTIRTYVFTIMYSYIYNLYQQFKARKVAAPIPLPLETTTYIDKLLWNSLEFLQLLFVVNFWLTVYYEVRFIRFSLHPTSYHPPTPMLCSSCPPEKCMWIYITCALKPGALGLVYMYQANSPYPML